MKRQDFLFVDLQQTSDFQLQFEKWKFDLALIEVYKLCINGTMTIKSDSNLAINFLRTQNLQQTSDSDFQRPFN